jgi:hypothetical protein
MQRYLRPVALMNALTWMEFTHHALGPCVIAPSPPSQYVNHPRQANDRFVALTSGLCFVRKSIQPFDPWLPPDLCPHHRRA